MELSHHIEYWVEKIRVLVINNLTVVFPLLLTFCFGFRGESFKTEISHSVTQPVIHPSFLLFKIYLPYKFLFRLDQILYSKYFELLKQN